MSSNSRRRTSSFFFFSSSSSTTFTQNDQTTLPPSKTIQIPITTIHQLPLTESLAATKIQSNYRTHLIKTLYKTISTINIQTTYLQNMIQRQETVDLIRSNEREKIRLNEALMILLLTLDSVKGIDPTVRDARRKVSRRIVELQEILDGISDERVMGIDELMRKWEEMVIDMEKQVWEEDEDRLTKSEKREMERFCFQKLGFRCMERFLHS